MLEFTVSLANVMVLSKLNDKKLLEVISSTVQIVFFLISNRIE